MRKLPDPQRFISDLRRYSEMTDLEEAILSDFLPEEVIRILGPVLTDERKKRIDGVISRRTRSVVPVIEGVLNTGNISAVMRTSEALGFQDFHIITNNDSLKHSERTSTGAEKWLDIRTWNDGESCIRFLRDRDYRVVVTHVNDQAAPLSSLDFDQKIALIFGNELSGVSKRTLELADATCRLPIDGFVQSYNVSVAAAIALYHAHFERAKRLGDRGDLSEDEALRLRAAFFIRATDKARDIMARARDEL